MEKLHEDQYRTENFEPKEGQRGSLCSNKTGTRCPPFGNTSKPLPEETVTALLELAEVLKEIHLRLVSEGWIIKNGEFTPPKKYT